MMWLWGGLAGAVIGVVIAVVGSIQTRRSYTRDDARKLNDTIETRNVDDTTDIPIPAGRHRTWLGAGMNSQPPSGRFHGVASIKPR